MYPYLEIFGQRLYSFNMCLMFALLSIILLASRDLKKMCLEAGLENKMFVIIPFFVLSGCVMAVFSDQLFRRSVENAIGATFLGWLSGVILVFTAYSALSKIRFLFLMNFYLPSFALAQAFGRIGCFLGGCCFGRPGFFGFAYPEGSPPHAVYGDCTLYPVQLIEAAFLCGVFFVCRRLVHFRRRGGVYLMLMTLGRFAFELLRGDNRGDFAGITVFSPAQIVSICLFIFGAVIVSRHEQSGTIMNNPVNKKQKN